MDKPWLIVKMKQNDNVVLPMKTLTEGWVALQFKEKAILEVFIYLQDVFKEIGIEYKTEFENFSLFSNTL